MQRERNRLIKHKNQRITDVLRVIYGVGWYGEVGARISPAGYDALEAAHCQRAESKDALSNLSMGSRLKADRGRLVCEVFVGIRNLVGFFPEY